MKTKDKQKEISIIEKQGINYLLDDNGKIIKFRPWLGDIFSFFYDRVMEKSIFPKLLNADNDKHFEILEKELKHVHNSNILEIAVGSGTSAEFISNDNEFTGLDISKGLLKKAGVRFKNKGFTNFNLYNASADNLPFNSNSFDFAICNLSLNFFDNFELFTKELRNVLKINSTIFCSVPIPERKPTKSKIRGKLRSEEQLILNFEKYGFDYVKKPYRNGAVLYFAAVLKEK